MTMSESQPHGVLTPFIFTEHAVRGAVVQVTSGWEQWLDQRYYPATVATLLGQAMAAAPLLAASLKFEGKLSLQAEGDGAVSMLVVQANHELDVRGMVNLKSEVTEVGGAANPAIFGEGRLGMILEPANEGQRYEALVPLDGETLGECLAGYFSQSEQLDTRVLLAADESRLAGVLLQKMPAENAAEQDEDSWPRLTTLLETLTDEELLALPAEEQLHRLFHEEEVALFDPRPVNLRCQCSHARTSALLLGMGETEVRSILEEQGQVEMECGFCGLQYHYLATDVEQLFSAESAEPDSTLRH